MSTLRERLEAADLQRRYDAQSAPKQTAQDTRADLLAVNAKKIQQNRVTMTLIDMDDCEREVVFDIINKERPASLGNPDVIEGALLRVRAEGTAALREVMAGTTKHEQSAVWEILKTASAEARLGMDGGRACKDALQQVRHQQFMEE
jgi:hypothetical protein